MVLTRRKFFSFFGTGVALLAKPDLLLPMPPTPLDGEPLFGANRFGVTGSNVIAEARGLVMDAEVRKVFAENYVKALVETNRMLAPFRVFLDTDRARPARWRA